MFQYNYSQFNKDQKRKQKYILEMILFYDDNLACVKYKIVGKILEGAKASHILNF